MSVSSELFGGSSSGSNGGGQSQKPDEDNSSKYMLDGKILMLQSTSNCLLVIESIKKIFHQ